MLYSYYMYLFICYIICYHFYKNIEFLFFINIIYILKLYHFEKYVFEFIVRSFRNFKTN